MDATDLQLLLLLQKDGRMTVSELSKQLRLSRPSVTERLHRLQERGIIEGFTATVSPDAVGRGTLLFIQISELKVTPLVFEKAAASLPVVLECHRVTGHIGYILKAAVAGMEELRILVERLMPYGTLQTSIVLASPVGARPVVPCKLQ
ncbi:Lrp/AsnC family transcriptional regulator [Paenibacillus gansuensis]|uniref:Lrp/AsnC family transcriptional regulator n=1 Tax=Paenibacillus gansuensis TaxID=306542 RepID=A0ABW5PB80_9BACL